MRRLPNWGYLSLTLSLALLVCGPGSSQINEQGSAEAEIATDPLKLDLSRVSETQRSLLLRRLRGADALVRQSSPADILVDRTAALETIRRLQEAGLIRSTDLELVRAELLVPERSFLERLVQVQQTHEPQASSQIILREHQLALAGCRPLSGNRRVQCEERVNDEYRELLDAANRMAAADPAGECGRAARTYGATVRQCGDGACPNLETTLMTQGAAVDRACLATVDTLPSAAASYLQQIAIVEAEVNGVYQPICGGLFLGGDRLLTAHHCFEPDTYRRLVAAGKVRVRVASGAAGQFWRVRPFDAATAADLATPRTAQRDYAIVATEGGPAVGAAPSLNQQAEVAEVLVVGHFRHFDRSRIGSQAVVAGVSVDPTWRAGLRFSKPGTCWVVGRAESCLRLYCQTIPGFSGTPILRAASGGPGSGRLMGLVSRRADDRDRCEAPGLLQGLTIGSIPPAALLQGHARTGGGNHRQAKGVSR